MSSDYIYEKYSQLDGEWRTHNPTDVEITKLLLLDAAADHNGRAKIERVGVRGYDKMNFYTGIATISYNLQSFPVEYRTNTYIRKYKKP